MRPTAAGIVRLARQMIGTPWHHQGRVPQGGVDCAGVCFCVGWGVGLEMSDFVAYGPDPHPDVMRAAIADRMDEVAFDDLTPGCVVLVRSRSGSGQHLGIVVGNDWVHADREVGSVVLQPFPESVRRRMMVAVLRYRGVDY